ncbi:MAG: hypothetical protein QM817_40895 [Archangium sp.]
MNAGYPERSLLNYEATAPEPKVRFSTRPGTGTSAFLGGKLVKPSKDFQLELERLRAAWLGRHDAQDDAEARLHAEEFVPLIGGKSTKQTIEVPKPQPEARSAVRFSPTGAFSRTPPALETETLTVEKAAPRFWLPRDTVMSVLDCRRSFAHGFDGRLRNGFLEVREATDLIDQRVVQVSGLLGSQAFVVTGEQILETITEPREAPAGVRALCEETALLDENSANAISAVVSAASGLPLDTIRKSVIGDQRLQWFAGRARPEIDDWRVSGRAGLKRLPPSRIALGEWRQAWIPIAVDWRLDLFRDDHSWKLSAFDYVPTPPFVSALTTGTPAVTTQSGRSMLTEGALSTIAARLAEDASVSQHVDVANAAIAADLAAVTLPVRARAGRDFFGGAFKPTAVHVVDVFGQVRQVPAANMAIAADDQLDTKTLPNWFALPPRFQVPARIGFRFLDASNDESEAMTEAGAVCGYLLPDHLDDALELYTPSGQNIGQLRSRDTAFGEKETLWEEPPMASTSLGAIPKCENRHLQELARSLQSAKPDSKETALSAFLRTADATLWTVDPIGRGVAEHLALVVGRPIAVLRARVRLEFGEPVPRDDVRLRVRVGVTTRQDDGVIGVFVDDDYTRFYSVHRELAANALPIGKGLGPLGSPNDQRNFEKKEPVEPVEHPYIVGDDSFPLMPNQTRVLTILVDPRASLHITSGAFPRKGAEVPESILRGLLDKLAVTFRMGPLLSDPEAIRMPLPAEIKGRWSWVHRVDPTNWKTEPIESPNTGPRLDPRPVRIVDGWLRLETVPPR